MSCFIKTENMSSAVREAKYLVERDHMHILSFEGEPLLVTREMFYEREQGLKSYDIANQYGRSVFYAAWGDVTEPTWLEMPQSGKFNRAEYNQVRKKLSRKGRCLHFSAGERCNSFINAHSIQKSQSLATIQQDGHVYYVGDSNWKSRGIEQLHLRGINKVSTFSGFCEYHDNDLFAPIDDEPFTIDGCKVALYAYRSICRELFLKENALDTFNHVLDQAESNPTTQKLVDAMRKGTQLGLDSLRTTKREFDDVLRTRNFSEIEYIAFLSTAPPNIVFSGLHCPVFDFEGRTLQDLADFSAPSSMLTFSSAPMEEGWAFLVAWHKNQADICRWFITSQANLCHNGSLMSEALFRFAMLSCENLAISPAWWDSLAKITQNEVLSRIQNNFDPLADFDPNYLNRGLEGICDWEFGEVISNMPSREEMYGD